MEQQVQVIRSRRRTLCVEIRCGQVLVRAPTRMADAEIRAFLKRKEDWIQVHLEQARRREAQPRLTEGELGALANEARRVIPARVAWFAPTVGVGYGRVTVRSQRSLGGSCSARGNLSFNCLLMQCPPEVLDYVVVHELCHRKQMNHSPAFWAEVERVLPDYRACRAWLREHGGGLIERLRA